MPCSVLYGGWKKFIMNNATTANNGSIKFQLPFWNPIQYDADGLGDSSIGAAVTNNDDILDPLGYRVFDDTNFWNSQRVVDGAGPDISVLPFLAYHLIWDTFYRNKNVTKSIFDINADVETVTSPNVSRVWHSFYQRGALLLILLILSFLLLTRLNSPTVFFFGRPVNGIMLVTILRLQVLTRSRGCFCS